MQVLEWVAWLTPLLGRFDPGKGNRYALCRRSCGPPEPVWADVESHFSTEIRSPDCPARRKSLYGLLYPGLRVKLSFVTVYVMCYDNHWKLLQQMEWRLCCVASCLLTRVHGLSLYLHNCERQEYRTARYWHAQFTAFSTFLKHVRWLFITRESLSAVNWKLKPFSKN